MKKAITLIKSEVDTLINKLIKELEFLEDLKVEEGDYYSEEDEKDRQNIISIIKKLKEIGVEWKKKSYGYEAMIDGHQVVRMKLGGE